MKVFCSSTLYYSFLLLLMLVLCSCSNTYVEDVKRGSDYSYEPGYPELWFEPAGTITPAGDAILKIAGTIPKSSLIYKKAGDDLKATVKITIDITNTTTDDIKTDTFIADISQNQNMGSYDKDLYIFNKEYTVQGGYFDVSVSLVDQATGKSTTREAKAHIPVVEDGVRNITNIRLLAKHEGSGGQYEMVPTYDVNKNADSLKFEFQISNTIQDNPNLSFDARLIKFKTDTTFAKSWSANNRSPSSIEYKGINYRDYQIIQSTKRQLSQPGNVTIEFIFDNLPKGNYRFEVGQDLDDRGPLYKARDFSIKGNNYPLVQTPREFAEPLIYLMDEKEYEQLMSIQSDDSLKVAVDRFWLQNIPNTSVAKSVISMYYHRVEEANKLFSNFKEGWKTDMGMLYILLGPPFFQKKSLNELQWSYTYDITLPEYNFLFKRNKSKSGVYPFEHYILQRDNIYFQIEYKARRLWLTGMIMTASI